MGVVDRSFSLVGQFFVSLKSIGNKLLSSFHLLLCKKFLFRTLAALYKLGQEMGISCARYAVLKRMCCLV